MTSSNLKLGRLLQERNLKDRSVKDKSVKDKNANDEGVTSSFLPEDLATSAGDGETTGSRSLNMSRNVKVIHTALIFLVFLGFGLCRGIYGPTLLELAHITCVSLAQISVLFTCLGVGGIAGSLVFGRLFDRFNPLILFVVSVAALGLVTAMIPWLELLILMMVMCAAHSFFYSGLAIGCNVTLFRLWQEGSGPIFLAMHLLYTLGGFITPLLSEPFLMSGPSTSITLPNITLHHEHSVINNNRTFNITLGQQSALDKDSTGSTINTLSKSQQLEYGKRLDSGNLTFFMNKSLEGSDLLNVTNLMPSGEREENGCWRESKIYLTYAILCLYLLLVSASIAVLLIYMRNKKAGQYWREYRPPESPPCWGGSSLYRLLATILFTVFNMHVGGQETLYCGLLFTYAVEHVGFTHTQGTFLVSMLFTAFAIGRFCSIFVGHWVSTAFYVLLLNLLGTFAASLTLAYFTTTSYTAVWVVAIIEGLCLSTMYPMGLLWAKDFVPITASFNSLYTIAFTCGMMVWPPLTSSLMKRYHPGWFAYMNVILVLCCAVSMMLLAILHKLRFRFKTSDQQSHPEIKTLSIDLAAHSMHSINTI